MSKKKKSSKHGDDQFTNCDNKSGKHGDGQVTNCDNKGSSNCK